MKKILLTFAPFWFFLLFSKFGSGVYYASISPLGEQLLPLWLVGVMAGGGSFLQMFLDVGVGKLLDKLGYLRLLKFAAFVFGLAGICLIWPLSFTTYLFAFFFATIGWLFFEPGVNAYILSHAPEKLSGQFISFRDVFDALGIVASTICLGGLLYFGTQATGILLAIVMFVASGLLFLCKPDTKLTEHVKKHHPHQLLPILAKLDPASSMLMLLNFSGSCFYAVIWFVIPLVIVHQNNTQWLNFGLGMFDLAIVLFGFILGKLADHHNKRVLVFCGLLLFALSGLVLSFNLNWLFPIFAFLAAIGDEMTGVSLWSWLHHLDRDHTDDGLISGVITLAYDLGWAVGPAMAGVLYTQIGPSWTIAASASFIFITWIIYLFTLQKHKSLPKVLVPHHPYRPRHKT